MDAAVEIDVEELVCQTRDLFTRDQRKSDSTDAEVLHVGYESDHHGMCAICLNKIVLQETALVKGCEHAYCVTCILRWAAHKKDPTCPQCKHPFEFLNIHRALDGSIQDYMFEESVCLLLRATWFRPLAGDEKPEIDEYTDDFYLYDEYEEEDDLDEAYLCSSSGVRLGNRRWGDNGYVRAGRQEVRPANRPNYRDSDAGPSRLAQKKEPSDELVGRRAKRAMKREAAEKAAAAKHQKHLARLGRDK
ncbi:hypothetical protein DM860_009945 [Cuscuta australis]|uniref:RING-type domain-containing protein n=1 Tax=Cuscuta australis TaxID=267555 RepID=A0A328DGT6_9ASTE|nr:hypothetical protein DM860_009945 [Cuscuta australis]